MIFHRTLPPKKKAGGIWNLENRNFLSDVDAAVVGILSLKLTDGWNTTPFGAISAYFQVLLLAVSFRVPGRFLLMPSTNPNKALQLSTNHSSDHLWRS